jgi:antitoxin (DNA-binding transcriptional repressor) of toxin-antitoxin stability system
MKTLTLNEQTSGAEIVQAAESEDVLLLKDGRAVALIVPFDDDDADWYGRERDPAFLHSIQRAREQVKQGRTRSHDEVKRELGID